MKPEKQKDETFMPAAGPQGPSSDEQGVNVESRKPGTFDSESGRAAVQKRWARARARAGVGNGDDTDPNTAGAPVADTGRGEIEVTGSGLLEPSRPRAESERDREIARQAPLRVIRNPRSPQASVVSAAKELASLEERAQVQPLPRSVREVQAMSMEQLYAAIRQLEGE